MNENICKKNKSDVAKQMVCDVKKDLHIHTFFSDGELSPLEVVDKWKSEGYELIAITDHDGIEGSVIGAEYASSLGLGFITGIEFDSFDDAGCDGIDRDLHILGYGVDLGSPILGGVLDDILRKRESRNSRMFAALNDMGYGISDEDIMSINEGRYVGKPTFARILVNKGFARTPAEVFDTIFRSDAIRAVSKEPYSSKDVIDTIHGAGGLAVLAHPMEQRHRDESLEDFIPRLIRLLDRMVAYGIDGIECKHPSASEALSSLLEDYARERGLITTEGSDFHSDKLRRDFSRYHRP